MLIRPKISGPEILLKPMRPSVKILALHPQLQIVLTNMGMVLLVRDESTFPSHRVMGELMSSLFVHVE